jgi:hypothetical protein
MGFLKFFDGGNIYDADPELALRLVQIVLNFVLNVLAFKALSLGRKSKI